MTQYKSREIEKSLTSKGFRLSYHSKHKFLIFYVNGKKTRVFTFLSHGTKTYDDSLLSKMKRQLYVEKNELCDLIECPLSAKEYTSRLFKKGIIK